MSRSKSEKKVAYVNLKTNEKDTGARIDQKAFLKIRNLESIEGFGNSPIGDIRTDRSVLKRIEDYADRNYKPDAEQNMSKYKYKYKYDLFEYVIPAYTVLYKGVRNVDDKINLEYDSAMWVATKEDITKYYGGNVYKFITLQDLKLVNIQSKFFHIFIMDFVNNMFKDLDEKGAFHEKMRILFPLGLPDIKTQQKYLARSKNLSQYMRDTLPTDSEFFYNTNRLSLIEHDKYLAGIMSIMLSKYGFVGYISPAIWPSNYHHRFHEEVCLFYPSQTSMYFKSIKRISISTRKEEEEAPVFQYGGSQEQKITNSSYIEAMRLFNYNGRIEYDEFGNVKIYNLDYINAYNRKKIYEKETGKKYPDDIKSLKVTTDSFSRSRSCSRSRSRSRTSA
jgi:hypothetical protein